MTTETKPKHTPEPWQVTEIRRGYLGDKTSAMAAYIHICEDHKRNAPCEPICDMEKHSPVLSGANAARIVACVNACAGMVDPAADLSDVRKALAGVLNLLGELGGEEGLSVLGKRRIRAAHVALAILTPPRG